MQTIWQDLRYSARMLWKRPGFTMAVSLTLALGIGANTAIFGVVDRLLVRLLPVNEPARLVNLIGRDEKGGEDTSFSYPIYKDYRDQNDVFDGLLAYSETAMNLSEGGQPERIMGVLVSGDYFDALGATPALGRAFLPEEDRTPGAHPVAVVSYGLWRRRFGADPKLVGRPGMLLPAAQNYFPDLSLHLRSAGDPASLIESARRELRALDPQLPATNIRTLEEQRRNSLYSERVTALLLSAFGALALLLAALGIYGVMAYAVAQRTREFGIRMALGARAGDVLRLMLRQGARLIGAGVALGLAGAFAATRLIRSFLYQVSYTDPMAFVLAALLGAAVALLACYIPARRATKVDPMIALRHE